MNFKIITYNNKPQYQSELIEDDIIKQGSSLQQIKVITQRFKLLQKLQNIALLGMVIIAIIFFLITFISKGIEQDNIILVIVLSLGYSIIFLIISSLIIQLLKYNSLDNIAVEATQISEITWNTCVKSSKEELNQKDLTYIGNKCVIDNSSFEIHKKSAFFIGKNNLDLVRLTDIEQGLLLENPSEVLNLLGSLYP